MAENEFYPRLCGGTFFLLVLKAMKPRTQMRGGFGSTNDGLTEPNCLAGLIQVFYPGYKKGPDSTFGPNTTAYKKCEDTTGSAYLPFDYTETIESFHGKVTTRYAEPLAAMNAFVESFVSTDALGEWLVHALFELIRDDQSIDDDELFYVTPDGKPTRKDRLSGLSIIHQQAFMLGVWDYVLKNRPDNTVGQATFAEWYKAPKNRGGRYKWQSSIGNDKSVAFSVVALGAKQKKEPVTDEHKTEDGQQAPSVALTAPAVDYSDFLLYEKDAYGKVKTLLYEQPQDFYSFYVCSNIGLYQSYRERQKHYISRKRIENATIEKISEFTNFAFLVGTGGLGKSMMMRHLLLDAIANFGRTNKVPVFISLKEYGNSDGEIVDFLYAFLSERIEGLKKEEFIRSLGNGDYVFLLDGLDEINSSARGQFENRLGRFSDNYKNITVIVSSRPYSRFIHMSRYTVLILEPFTKDQALKLIDNLEYDPGTKDKFREDLDNSLFNLHKDFAENPLLLTIMLRTYDKFRDIPSQIHYFYKNAYYALAIDHDDTKDHYKRPFKTRMSMERFEEYLAEFCALTYTEEKYDLTDEEAKTFFSDVKEHIATEVEKNISAADFMEDLCANLCMMEHDGEKYYFTHRSFQEYFCALFLSRQMDEDLEKIGEFFDQKHARMVNDKTFLMMYDMITKKVEKFIFVPLLEKLLSGDYWTFIQKAYGDVYLDGGEIPDWTINDPDSYIYFFIIDMLGCQADFTSFEAPHLPEFTCNEYAYGVSDSDDLIAEKDDEYEPDEYVDDPDTELMDVEDICYEYKDNYGDPDVVGWTLEIDSSKINEDGYKEIKAIMEQPDFPLQKEYDDVKCYLERLKEEQSKPKNTLKALFKR